MFASSITSSSSELRISTSLLSSGGGVLLGICADALKWLKKQSNSKSMMMAVFFIKFWVF